MRWAIIENGVVTNVVSWDGTGDIFEGLEIIQLQDDLVGIGWLYSDGKFTNPNEPQPPSNSQLLKDALSSLSAVYQQDIETLNRAWLAAAVNDGLNENTKKSAVLSQITTRKAKYASDRAAVIAQYPV